MVLHGPSYSNALPSAFRSNDPLFPSDSGAKVAAAAVVVAVVIVVVTARVPMTTQRYLDHCSSIASTHCFYGTKSSLVLANRLKQASHPRFPYVLRPQKRAVPGPFRAKTQHLFPILKWHMLCIMIVRQLIHSNSVHLIILQFIYFSSVLRVSAFFLPHRQGRSKFQFTNDSSHFDLCRIPLKTVFSLRVSLVFEVFVIQLFKST